MTAWLPLTVINIMNASRKPRTKLIEVDDNDAFDMIEVRVNLRHRAGVGDPGYVVHKAGMNYQLPYQTHYSQALDLKGPDDEIARLVGHKATEAVKLLLDHRREIDHKHKKMGLVDG